VVEDRRALDAAALEEPALAQTLRCDFCGETAVRVRRIALDQGYERLQTPHRARYACERCSQQKERRRLGEHRA
jgi:hypothetical protein